METETWTWAPGTVLLMTAAVVSPARSMAEPSVKVSMVKRNRSGSSLEASVLSSLLQPERARHNAAAAKKRLPALFVIFRTVIIR